MKPLAFICALAAVLAQSVNGSPSPSPSEPCYTVELDANDSMQFVIKGQRVREIRIPKSCAGKLIGLRLHHTGKLPASEMPHNLVIAASDRKVEDLAKLYIAAGLDPGRLDGVSADLQQKKWVLAHTRTIGGGQTSERANVPAGATVATGKYAFYCSTPGHSDIMNGYLIFE